MKILAHRGFWNEQYTKNSLEAIRYALDCRYGFESDIRDYDCKLVISHDIATTANVDAEKVFLELAKHGDKYCFAINIKSDGLKDTLFEQLSAYKIKNYFAFDMSVPQMVEYIEKGITVFTRQSEYEKEPVLYSEAKGVWVDGFNCNDWITEELLRDHIEKGKEVCVVSPELHGRKYHDFWEKLLGMKIDFSKVLLCTDKPDEAKDFLGASYAN